MVSGEGEEEGEDDPANTQKGCCLLYEELDSTVYNAQDRTNDFLAKHSQF